jgi:hypothetical protein
MSNLIQYKHPNSAFSTEIPSDWRIADEDIQDGALVNFISPDEHAKARIAVYAPPSEGTEEAYEEMLIQFVIDTAGREKDFDSDEPETDDETGTLEMGFEYAIGDTMYIASAGLWEEQHWVVMYAISLPYENEDEDLEDTLLSIVDATHVDLEEQA